MCCSFKPNKLSNISINLRHSRSCCDTNSIMHHHRRLRVWLLQHVDLCHSSCRALHTTHSHEYNTFVQSLSQLAVDVAHSVRSNVEQLHTKLLQPLTPAPQLATNHTLLGFGDTANTAVLVDHCTSAADEAHTILPPNVLQHARTSNDTKFQTTISRLAAVGRVPTSSASPTAAL